MQEKLKDLITGYVEVERDAITVESRFIEDLAFTSYDFISLIGEVEDEFGVEFDEKDIITARTVGDAASRIERLYTA